MQAKAFDNEGAFGIKELQLCVHRELEGCLLLEGCLFRGP